jgi:hypothetical protein
MKKRAKTPPKPWDFAVGGTAEPQIFGVLGQLAFWRYSYELLESTAIIRTVLTR